jgi:hypothetical protein
MISNNRLAGLVRISCAVAMLSALGGMAGCSGNSVGPEPPWNLSADEGPTEAAPTKLHEGH